jgi:hypothetical protein
MDEEEKRKYRGWALDSALECTYIVKTPDQVIANAKLFYNYLVDAKQADVVTLVQPTEQQNE